MNLEKREANIHTRSVSPSLRPPQGGIVTRECDGFTTNSPSSSSSSCPDHIKRLSLLPCLEGVAELNFSSSSNAAWRGPRISLLPPPPPFVTALLSRKGTRPRYNLCNPFVRSLFYYISPRTIHPSVWGQRRSWRRRRRRNSCKLRDFPTNNVIIIIPYTSFFRE